MKPQMLTLSSLGSILLLGFSNYSYAETGLGTIGYGGKCVNNSDSDSQLCIASKHLICVAVGTENPAATICQCQNHMYYDLPRERCVVKAEERCLERFDSEIGAFPTTCTEHSFCAQPGINREGLCKCADNYISDWFGFCKLGHGASGCLTDFDCEVASFLICGPQKTCVCDQVEAIWDMNLSTNKSQCLSTDGGRCAFSAPEPTSTLATTSAIIPADAEAPERKCSPTADCTSGGSCTCKAGYIPAPTLQFQCLLNLNETCTSDSDCHPNFRCYSVESNTDNTVCTCPEGQTLQNSTCYINAGKRCDSVPDVALCVEHASCKINDGGSYSICRCDQTYSATNDGLCLLDYGIKCSDTNPCNFDAGLDCVGGECVCRANFTYGSYYGYCVPNVGQTCGQYGACVSRNCDPDSNLCVCLEGSTAAPDNSECFADFGENCGEFSYEMKCDNSSHLQCSFGTCRCPSGFVNVTNQLCLGSFNASCADTTDCVPNAICSDDSTCQCAQGFSANFDTIRCELDHGESCENNQDLCNSYKYLACVGFDGSAKCACQNSKEQIYNTISKSCRGVPGSNCSYFSDNYCVDSAQCTFEHLRCYCEYGFEDDGKGGCQVDDGDDDPNNSSIDARPIMTLSLFSVIVTILMTR